MKLFTRLTLLLAFLIMCLPVMAATVTVQAYTPGGTYSYGGTTAHIRIYASYSFVTSTPVQTVMQGTTTSFFQDVTCTVAFTTLNCPQFTINSTTDSTLPGVRYTADLYDWQGRFRQRWLDPFFVPPTPTPTTWDTLRLTSGVPTPSINSYYYTASQIDGLLGAKQPTLTCSTTLKTINTNCLLGSGDLTIAGGAGTWGTITGTLSSQSDLNTALAGKQAALVSGTNIKTINSQSLLGSGDIAISGGSGVTLANTYGNSLPTAITAIGATPTTLIIDSNTTVSTFLTVPATLVLEQRNDAVITITSAGQLTFLGKGVANPISQKPFFASSFNTELPTTENVGFSSAGVNTTTDTILLSSNHPWTTGQQLTYTIHPDGGDAIGGLTHGGTYYAIVVSANSIKLASTLANALSNTPIDLTSVGAPHDGFMRVPIAWTGTTTPSTISSELVDTGNTSVSNRINLLAGAFGGHSGTIFVYAGRFATTYCVLPDGISLRFGPGDHQNTFNVATQFFVPYYIGSHSYFTSEPGAIIYESSVFGRNTIVMTRNGITDAHIVGNHFKGNGAAFNSSDGGIMISNSSDCSIENNWTDGLNSYHIGIIQNGYTLDSDTTFTNANVNTGSDTIAVTGHGYRTGVPFTLLTSGTLPAPLATSTTYYAIVIDTNTLKVATSRANALAGTAIDLTTTGDSASKTIHVGNTGKTNWYVRNNLIKDNLITGYVTQLLFIIGAQQARLTGNRIILDNLDIGFTVNCAIVDFEPNTQFESISDIEFDHNYISTRNIVNAYTRGIEVQSIYTEGTRRIKIHDNTFVFFVPGDLPTLNLNGVAIDHGASDIDIYNNTFVGSGYSDISATLARNVRVHDNTSTGAPYAQFNTVYDSVVKDNQLGRFLEDKDRAQYLSSDASGRVTLLYPVGSPEGGAWDWFVGLPVFFNETVYTIQTVYGNETNWAQRQLVTNPSFPANIPIEAVPSTSVDTTADEITTPTNHLLVSGDRVNLLPESGATMPGGLPGDQLYIIKTANNKYKLAATHADALAGIAVNITSQGSGTVDYAPGWTLQFGSIDLHGNRINLDDQIALDPATRSQIISTAYDNKITNVADTAYTVHHNDGTIVYTSLTTGRTVTLPSAAGIKGKVYVVKDGTGTASAHNITITAQSGEQIEGQSTLALATDYGLVRLKSTSTGWIVLQQP
jgi:hypothetical protein